MKKITTLLFLICQTIFLLAQITVDIHPNFKHTVGGNDRFDRQQMLKIHADQTENEWTNGNHFGDFTNLRDSFLNGYDVYMGRNTGGISFWLNQVSEDPSRPGFANPADIANRGQISRNNYANNAGHQLYEFRNELVIAAQQRPFYPDGTLTGQGWALANGTATGEYMGRYINEFHGGNGKPKPAYIEIMNEPLYEFTTIGNVPPIDIFNFHNDAADAIRAQVDDIPIGGYCAAFPNFEEDNFQRWNNRMKLFMDTSGDKMDFWSIHFYDFNGTNQLRRGANIEATMDMIDHYSMLSFDEVKPYVISEYGGRARNIEANAWTPFRDWQTLKSWTSMLLTFSERPQDVVSAIPFIIVKALWGTQSNGSPYPWRLMRQKFEMPGETGQEWVFTDMFKFYQLWSDVKGTRIDTRSTDPDIQSNSFVDGNKMYLILNNLNNSETMVNLNMVENQGNSIQNIRVKHLFLNAAGNAPVLSDDNFSTLEEVTIGADGAMVIEYTFQNDVLINELVDETKYFADTYLTPIVPLTDHLFNINGVNVGEKGEAVLRLGMGRPHGKSLQPIVKINGIEVQVPENYAGYNQEPKDSWFGVIEIPVPINFLQTDNEITVRFDDTEGHISSMALRFYNHSNDIFRSDNIPVTAFQILPEQKSMLPNTDIQLVTALTPDNATNPSISWTSSNPSIATVDNLGNVSALILGTTTITATEMNSGLSATSIVEVVEMLPFVSVTGLDVQPASVTIIQNETAFLQATVSPIDASDRSVTWSSADPQIATVDENGLVEAISEGTTNITATTVNENISASSVVTVLLPIAPSIAFVNESNLLSTEFEVGGAINVSAQFHAGSGNTVIDGASGGVKFWLRELEPGFIVVNDYVVSDASAIGEESGIAQGVIPLTNVPATVDIPDDNFYFLFTTFSNSNGENFNVGIFPINIVRPVNTTSIEFTDLEIYPNPSNGEFILEIPNLEKTMTLIVTNATGKQVLKQPLDELKNFIKLGPVPAGLYHMEIKTENGSVTKRIVIK